MPQALRFQLFGDLKSGMEWLPDETLFSLVCRFHYLACLTRPEVTLRTLFGYRRSRCAHDFPGHLNEFVARTHGKLGDAQSLIRERTLAACFLPFRPIEDCDRIYSAMRTGGLTHVKFMAGITTSTFRGHHPQKACPKCMLKDSEQYGTTYWHQSHLLPGAWICGQHRELLLVVKEGHMYGTQRVLSLPHHVQLVTPVSEWRESEIGMAKSNLLQKMSRMASRACLEKPGYFADAGRLSSTYRRSMMHQGLVSSHGRICWDAILKRFAAHIAPLTCLTEFSMLGTNERALHTFLARLLYQPRTHTHPLRHLILISWLYPTWESFLRSYGEENVGTSDSVVPKLPSKAKYVATGRDTAISLLMNGDSPTAVAKFLSVDVVTVCAWGAGAGMRPNRRPKLLDAGALQRMIGQLLEGCDKQEAADAAGVSVQTVTRVLRTEPGLQQAWHRQRFASSQRTARDRWSALIASTPDISNKMRRNFDPKTFAWLYRNDRQWLTDITKSTLQVKGSNHATARWEQRDDVICNAVQRAALWSVRQKIPITLAELCRLVPELSIRLAQLQQLPQTQRAIERALSSTLPLCSLEGLMGP